MGDWKHHCGALGVAEDASAEEIKAAYRRLALCHHPDRNGGTPQSKERFQQLNISYSYLLRNLGSRPTAPAAASHVPPPAFKLREVVRPTGHARQARATSPAPAAGRAQRPRPAWLNLALRLVPGRGDPLLSAIPAATAVMASLVAVFAFIYHNVPGGEADRLPAAIALGENVDESDPSLQRCSIEAFRHGRRMISQKSNGNQRACEQTCDTWLARRRQDDISCSWNNIEFQRRNIPDTESIPSLARPLPSPPPPPPPRRGLRNDGYFDDPTPGAHPEIIYAGELARDGSRIELPDVDRNTPLMAQRTKVGEHPELEFPVTPRVWVSDKRLLLAAPGTNRLKVILTPIRKGEVEVVITDGVNRPIGIFHYSIE